MSLWSIVVDKLKEVLSKMIGSKTIEKALNVTPVISSEMEQAIQLWTDMYKNQAYWLHEPDFEDPVRIVSLGLPALISSEKARMALIEFKSEITTPTEEREIANPDYKEPEPDIFGNILPSVQPPTIKEDVPVSDTTRAEYLNKMYQDNIIDKLESQLELGIAKGGLILKPYVVMSDNIQSKFGDNEVTPTAIIECDFIQADYFYPLAFDANGKITEAAFIQTKAERDIIYRRLEYHKWNGSSVKIINKAFKSQASSHVSDLNGLDLGKEVPLSDIPEWADFQKEVTINNVYQPLFAYFKMPEANTIDTASPLGVSGFSRAVSNIKDADMQYSRLLWEYEAGEMAVDIDRDAMRVTTDGNGVDHSLRPALQQRLFRMVDLGSEGDTYQPYSPALRDTSYVQGLNVILMRIEDICGLSRGVLSDASAEARTATELKILKQRSYQTNLRIQKALEKALRDVIYIMDVYCTLYNIVGDTKLVNGVPQAGTKGQWDVSFEWDDSILTDVDEELNKRLNLMQQGLASKLETRMWYFGETERQAEQALLKIQEESQQAMEENLMMQSNMMQQEEQSDV